MRPPTGAGAWRTGAGCRFWADAPDRLRGGSRDDPPWARPARHRHGADAFAAAPPARGRRRARRRAPSRQPRRRWPGLRPALARGLAGRRPRSPWSSAWETSRPPVATTSRPAPAACSPRPEPSRGRSASWAGSSTSPASTNASASRREAVERGARAGLFSETRGFTPDERSAVPRPRCSACTTRSSRASPTGGAPVRKPSRAWRRAASSAALAPGSSGWWTGSAARSRRSRRCAAGRPAATHERIVVDVHPRLPSLRSLAVPRSRSMRAALRRRASAVVESRRANATFPALIARPRRTSVRAEGLAGALRGRRRRCPLPLVVEIGFGRGEFLLDAGRAPARRSRIVGVEVSFKRVAQDGAAPRADASCATCGCVDAHGRGRGARAARRRPRVEAFWINFPDPWPKKRHTERRLIQPRLVRAAGARARCRAARSQVATDHVDYAERHRRGARGGAAPRERLRAGPSGATSPGRLRTAYEIEWRAEGRPLHFWHVPAPRRMAAVHGRRPAEPRRTSIRRALRERSRDRGHRAVSRRADRWLGSTPAASRTRAR